MRNTLRIDSRKPTRRSVMSSGLALVGGCFAGLDTRQVLAQAARTGKPPLTAGAINGMLQGPNARMFLADFKQKELADFLGQYFTLTERQAAVARTVSAAQLKDLQSQVEKAQQAKLRIEANDAGKFSRADKQARLDLRGKMDANVLTVSFKEMQ